MTAILVAEVARAGRVAGIAAGLTCLTFAVLANPIEVLSLDASRTFSFTENSGYSTLRADLADPSLFGRPMVTSPDATVAIEIEADGHDALVFCDGRREMLIPAGGRIEVTRCGTPVKWARLDSAPFTDRLVRKFRLSL